MMFPALSHTLYSCHTHVTISSLGLGAPLAEGPLGLLTLSFLSLGCSRHVTQAFTNM